MPYDESTVPDFKIKEASLGDIDIVYMGDSYVLYNNGKQWMVLDTSATHNSVKELYSSYDQAHGKVLATGLGFGLVALWLCNKPEVESVTILEISPEVIALFKAANEIPEKLNIIQADALTYETDEYYDCILLDHYETQDMDWRIANMREICNRIKHESFWAWSLEQAYIIKSIGSEDETIFKQGTNLGVHWQEFVKTHFPDEKSLAKISDETINEYVHLYYAQDRYL